MVDYKDYNDFELLYLICEQNESAFEILHNKYKLVVEIKAKKSLKQGLNSGLDYNDLVQEGMIGLNEAIRDFKLTKDVKFSTFANLCIDRQISSAIITANRKKHKILNESLSLEEKIFNSNQSLKDIVHDNKNNNPSDYIIEMETENETYNRIKGVLTPFEKKVFDLKANNFNYKEIADILGKSYKSIDSAIQRIKAKLRKEMNL